MKINGPIEIVYVVTGLFIVMTILLFTGKGSWLIAGYNTALDEEKEKYDKKKLEKVVGACTGFISVFMLIVCFTWQILPEWFSNVIGIVILIDVIVTIILVNTKCRK